MYNRRGFILEQVLLSIMIMCMLLPISVSCIQILEKEEFITQDIQDEIALRQLRRILLLSYNIEFSQEELSFVYQQKQWELYFRNQYLVLTPGTQIFVTDINQANFMMMDEAIYLVYERDGKRYEKILVKQS